MKICLFCNSGGPFAEEHIIPESLGNDELTLIDDVCAACNNHFSRKVEAPVLAKSPLAFWRAFHGIKTKRGKHPSVDLSQPKSDKGVFPSVHAAHDNKVGFSAHDDGSVSVDIDDPEQVRQIVSGARNQFKFVMSPALLYDLGRFLCKIGIELVCHADPEHARSAYFERARRFARFGQPQELWPIFHASSDNLSEARRLRVEDGELVADIDCYSYRLLEIRSYVLSELSIGTDTWVVCLNDPCPTPEIRFAFPGVDLQLIWYSKDQYQQ